MSILPRIFIVLFFLNLSLFAGEVLRDSRDGQTYPTVKAGKQTWMAKNLNYGNPVESKFGANGLPWGVKVCYEDIPSNCAKYGGLYDHASAKAACPTGWHLPTVQEFAEFMKLATDTNSGGMTLSGIYGQISLLAEYSDKFENVSAELSFGARDTNVVEEIWVLAAENYGIFAASGAGQNWIPYSAGVMPGRQKQVLTLRLLELLAGVRKAQILMAWGTRRATDSLNVEEFFDLANKRAVMQFLGLPGGGYTVPLDEAYVRLAKDNSVQGVRTVYGPVRCVKD